MYDFVNCIYYVTLFSSGPPDLLSFLFSALPDEDLRALMTRSLEQVDFLQGAVYQPVMLMGEWELLKSYHFNTTMFPRLF